MDEMERLCSLADRLFTAYRGTWSMEPRMPCAPTLSRLYWKPVWMSNWYLSLMK